MWITSARQKCKFRNVFPSFLNEEKSFDHNKRTEYRYATKAPDKIPTLASSRKNARIPLKLCTHALMSLSHRCAKFHRNRDKYKVWKRQNKYRQIQCARRWRQLPCDTIDRNLEPTWENYYYYATRNRWERERDTRKALLKIIAIVFKEN